mgnify:CR=1 FL=1
MHTSICSFSFHRLFGQGKMDFFSYITTCRELGCSHLQPWNAHFARNVSLEDLVYLGRNPGEHGAPVWLDPPGDRAYVNDICAAARAAGLPFELICVDRAAVYDADPRVRTDFRGRACRWIDFAATIGAPAVRIDAGGPSTADLPDDVFTAIAEGYRELIARGRAVGVSIFVENHWGSSNIPENIVRFLDTIDGLHFLFDTNNWADGRQQDGWRLCGPRAHATHVKTRAFDAGGNAVGVDIPAALALVTNAGYRGVWGVESVPAAGNELEAARATLALIRRTMHT